jgi:hypothetical protein
MRHFYIQLHSDFCITSGMELIRKSQDGLRKVFGVLKVWRPAAHLETWVRQIKVARKVK